MLVRRKPRNQLAKRVLAKREAKPVENPKSALFLRGQSANQLVSQCLKDLYALKKPLGVMLSRKNAILPFEDTTSLEFFSLKSDCSLFLLGSNTKKRPNNLVMGRLFDHKVLDMIELGIEKYVPMGDFRVEKPAIGGKHMFVFNGHAFQQSPEQMMLQSMFLDFYRGEQLQSVNLAGLDHVLSMTCSDDGRVYFRAYHVLLKKSGTRLPRIELEEMGPSIDFVVRRFQLSNPDTAKQALRVSRTLKPKKVKNVQTDELGHTYGQIHMHRQDLSKVALRKMKGLKKKRSPREDTDSDVPADSESSKRQRRDSHSDSQ